MQKITVDTTIAAPLSLVWVCWTEPKHITHWAFASDDWEAPEAENDLYVGGRFRTRMQAKDGSAQFDFTGMYTALTDQSYIAYDIDDGRHVEVTFEKVPEGIRVIETFDPEHVNPPEMQRAGWQAILEHFKKYVTSQHK